jgi:hypothetical protein
MTLSFSIDSFLAAFALAAAGVPAQLRWRIGLLFGLCDGLASLPHGYLAGSPPAIAMVCWMLLALPVAWQAATGLGTGSRVVIQLVPVVMSIDNLLWSGSGTLYDSAALTASGLLALLGFHCGMLVRRRTA